MTKRDRGYSDFMAWMLSAGYGTKQASAERSYLRRITTEQERDYSRAPIRTLQDALDNVIVPDREIPSRHNHRQALRRYIEFVEELEMAEDADAAARMAGARTLVREEHVRKAVRLIDEQGEAGLTWLYQRTGRDEPKHRYVVVDDVRYPTKAFGFLVAQLAGATRSTANVMTTEEAYAPLRRLGYVEVRGLSEPRTRAQADAAEASYYRSLARPQQAAFRRALQAAYSNTCALSGVAVAGSLEAAHVIPFRSGEDTLANGVLLRADLHRLFDRGQLAFEPLKLKAHFAPVCLPDYQDLHGLSLDLPTGGPTAAAFKERWIQFRRAW
jgi:hypothetical protein